MPEPHHDLLNELTPAEWRLVVSLVESIATSDEGECPVCRRQIDRSALAKHIAHCREFSVIRTRRLEVVDAGGTVRAVVGELDHPPAKSTVGLALLDPTGRERAVLALDHEGPQLEMTQGGNTALLLGVDDHTPEVSCPGCYFRLCKDTGEPVQSWQVNPDGTLLVLPPVDAEAGE